MTVEKDRFYRAEIEVRAETEKEAEEIALEMAEDLDDVDWDEEDESEEEETDEEIRFPEDEEYIEIIDENPGDDGMSEEAFEKIYGKTREQALQEAL